MDKTRQQSSQIMQPQYRNRHNFMIFGGFLLKQTFELAFCCAAAFSHSRPTFVSLDPRFVFSQPIVPLFKPIESLETLSRDSRAAPARKHSADLEKYNSTFENPVPVGSVLYLTATVAYTEPPLVKRTLGGDGIEDAADSHEERYTRVQVRIDSSKTSPTHSFFVRPDREHRDIVSVLPCSPRRITLT